MCYFTDALDVTDMQIPEFAVQVRQELHELINQASRPQLLSVLVPKVLCGFGVVHGTVCVGSSAHYQSPCLQ